MYIKYCEPCQMQNTHKLEKCPHLLKSIPVLAKCWSKIGLDLIGPFERIQWKKIHHFMCRYFSQYVEAKAIENKMGSAVGTFMYDLICRYGVMDITITD